MHTEIIEEFFIWRLVQNGFVTYSDLDNLSFYDALKMNAILNFDNDIKRLEEQKLKNKDDD